jgi:hypothetical protein
LLPELGSSAILGGKTWDLTSFQLVSWFGVAFEGNEMIAYLTGCLQAKQLEVFCQTTGESSFQYCH